MAKLQKKDYEINEFIGLLLSGQRKVMYKGIEVFLPTIKRDTTKRKELQAKKEAEKLWKLLN